MRKAKLSAPPIFTVKSTTGAQLVLEADTGDTAYVYVLEDDIIRFLLVSRAGPKNPRSWAIAPGQTDVPEPGRERFECEGFSCPPFTTAEHDGTLKVMTPRMRLTVNLVGLLCTWEQMIDGQWSLLFEDRRTQAYNFGWWDEKAHHYIARREGDRYYGLGERSGNLNLAGRRFRLNCFDPMGYDAQTTDGLYKSIPYLLVANEDNQCYGMFYDTMGEIEVDLGNEIDNYHHNFRHFSVAHGDIDLYVIAGPDPLTVTRRFTWLTGRPALMPAWSLGYSGSTMTYTDAPDAYRQMMSFVEKLREHDLGCTSFHFSSGYTSINEKRYVFNWNTSKFPDPKAFISEYKAAGIELVPNVKPGLLRSHPQYAKLSEQNIFVTDTHGDVVEAQFWDEVGSFVDFTKPQGAAWWRSSVRSALLEYGIASTWNDNNEYGIWDARAQFDFFGTPGPAAGARLLQSLLMMRASRQAQTEFYPERRPYVVTRSGMAGMQRYAQTWSGDNYTAWKTIRYNSKMGLGLALSAVSNTGHDIGGFYGPQPDPELFLRWVQAGIMLPRFSIHSWNLDGAVNEPWMYPDILPAIRNLLNFREQLLPYFFDQAVAYHFEYTPIMRPLWVDFPMDKAAWNEDDCYLFGPNLLVALVCDPGRNHATFWLPEGADWIEISTGRLLTGGQRVELEAPLEGLPALLARVGSALPVNLAKGGFAPEPTKRGVWLFPPQTSSVFTWQSYEDGLVKVEDGPIYKAECNSTPESIIVTIEFSPSVPEAQRDIRIELAKGESRNMVIKTR